MTKKQKENPKKERKEKNKQEKVIEPEVVGELTTDEKQMAMLGHLLAIVAGFLVPLIIYLMKKDESEFIKDQTGESLNFQISIFIYMLTGILITYASCGIGFFIPFGVAIMNLVLCIIAGLKANEGIKYRYPLNIRFIK